MFYFGFYPTSKGKIWRWVGMRIEGKEIGKETIAKVKDENDKDLNSQSLEQWGCSGRSKFQKEATESLIC